MPSIDFDKSLVCATGPGQTGKSNFFRRLFERPEYSRHIIIDTQREFDPEDYNVYRPDNLEYPDANEELNMVLGRMLSWPRSIRPRYIHVADCANFIPGGNRTVGSNVARLIQQNTHIYPGITFSCSARRPQNIDTDMRELADHFFIFGGKGKGTWRALDEIAEGLAPLVKGLDEYEFVHVGPSGETTVYGPVKDMGSYEEF